MGHFEKFSQEENLKENERILAYVEGSIQKTKREIPSKGILILTNLHLIFFRSGFTGKRLEKYPLGEITATSYKGSLMFKSSITVNFQSHAFDFLGDKKKLEDFYKKLDNRDELIAGSTPSSDAPSQQKSEAPLSETTPLKETETLSEKTEITPTEKSPLKSKILWGILGVFVFFIVLIAISDPEESNKASEQAEKEEVKDYSMYTVAAQKMCAGFLAEKIAPSVPKFPRRTARVIYQKKDAYRYLVKGTYELSSGSSEYTYYCDVLCNDNCKGEYARINIAHWTLNALEANKESNQSSSLEASWAKDASSEKIVFDDGSLKTQFGKDDHSIDAVNACQTLTQNGVDFVQSGASIGASRNKITSGANLFKNTSGLPKFTKWDSFFEEEAFLNASPEKKGKNRYIVEDTFVLYNPMEDKVVDGSPKYSLYCDITYTGRDDERYSLDSWTVNALKIAK